MEIKLSGQILPVKSNYYLDKNRLLVQY
jgi:hypothetical protein